MDMGRGWSVRCGRGLGGVLALACLAGCGSFVGKGWEWLRLCKAEDGHGQRLGSAVYIHW